MSELKVLYRHALHYLGGRVCLMLLGFVSFPVFTRVFSVADYGTMALVLKIILLFTVIAKFGLQNSVQRFYAEDGASQDLARSRKYYSTLFFGSVAVAAGVTLLFVAGLLLTPQEFLPRELQYLLLLTAALIVTRSVQPTLVGFLRAEGKTKTFNVVEVSVRAATVILSCILLLAWSRSLYVLFGTTLIVEALGILFLSSYLQRRNLLDLAAVDWSYFKSAAIFSFPLIGYELASVILDSGDRILVRRFLGAEQLGYYSAAYNISTYVEESLMMPINLALFPIYMKIWVEKGKDETQQFLSRSLNNFLALAIAIVCIVFLTSRDVVVVLASRKFQDAHRLLPVLVIGLLIYAIHIFLNAALLIHRKTATMTALVVGACAANILLNLVLIPRLGILGAAIATLLSYLLLVILMGRVSFRLIPLQISFVAFFANLASAGVTYALISRITIEKALLSAVVKGLLGLLLYTVLASLFNPVVRPQVANRIRAIRKRLNSTESP
jgi:O-antigen/teichoic acid export membrane protein